MGHSSINVTMDVYGHLMPGGGGEVAEGRRRFELVGHFDPKGARSWHTSGRRRYIYFAMAFSVGVEMLNLRMRRNAGIGKK